MDLLLYTLIFLCYLNNNFTNAEKSILCDKSFCQGYPNIQRGDALCPSLSSRCNKTDSTTGKYMLSPTPCNCCEFCLGYLEEGDFCSTGTDTTDFSPDVCGPGLMCSSDTKKCVQIDYTLCKKAQAEYDRRKFDGTLGEFQLRPECDEEGNYVPYHCIPGQICYCVDKDGNRIFGETANIETAPIDLICTCSRGYNDVSKVIGKKPEPGEYFRCSLNGAYEHLQCIDEKHCVCVDTEDGAPTYKNLAPVEIWAISQETLPCFNNKTQQKGVFYRKCEQEYMNKNKKIKEKTDEYNYVLPFELPKCTIDGWYAPVQEDSKTKYCANPDGSPIKPYILQKSKKNNENYLKTMNCKCALARRLVTSDEKPDCLINGNYNPKQVRRGKSYFVDEDGNQVVN